MERHRSAGLSLRLDPQPGEPCEVAVPLLGPAKVKPDLRRRVAQKGSLVDALTDALIAP